MMKKVASMLTAFLAVTAVFISCKAQVVTGETVPTVTEISVLKSPATTDYAVNTALDLSGLIVSAKYSNGLTGIITDYTTEPADKSILTKTGKNEVTVKYKDFSTSFSINVYEVLPSTEPVLEGVVILQQPSKTIYAQGEVLDLAGLFLGASYSDGKTTIVTDYTSEPVANSILEETGDKEVVISYKGFSATINISVYEKVPSSEAVLKDVLILQKPAKTFYERGEKLDLTGLLVGGAYSDNKTTIITDYSASPADGSELTDAGDQTVKVTFDGFEASFQIKVVEQIISNETYLESISVYQRPLKLSYEEGDVFDSTGLIVTGIYSDGLIGLISDYTVNILEGSVLSGLGTQTVIVTKGSLSSSFTIEVVEKVVYGTVPGISVTVADINDISIVQESVTNGIKFTAPDGFVSYKWQINNVTTGTEQEYILNTADLLTGTYEIFLVVKDENNFYKSATIFVQAGN